ncbi:MAG: hypothetical protein MJ016_01995 [Victivallaceae bacterium]|nr:hypothetical protein [Victivallaceae bacterium]
MKTGRRKKFFNMVEVALALLVISLGLSTVLTLFPAGLKATAEAENDNNVVEAAEAFFAYFNARVQSGNLGFVSSGIDTNSTFGASSGNKITSSGNVFVYHKIADGTSSAVEDFTCVAQVFAAENGVEDGDQRTRGGSIAYLPRFDGGGTSITENAAQFSPSNTYRFQTQSANSSGEVVAESLYAFDVDLSYPADKPYAERTHRVVRMVFYKF